MAEVPHGALCQTSRGEQAKKIQGFWEPFHRFGQVAVGTRVFRDPFPDFWKYMLEIQCINLLDWKLFRHRELQDESQSIGFQHTMDFGKALLQILGWNRNCCPRKAVRQRRPNVVRFGFQDLFS